jgi:outer membrane protein
MNTLLRVSIGTLALGLTLVSTQVNAADSGVGVGVGVGVINARRILSESKAAKEAMAQFRTDFGPREKDLLEQTQALQRKADDLDRALPTLTPTKQLERQRELGNLNRELERKKQVFNEDRETRRREDIQHVIQLARNVVARIAETARLDMVFQDVVYANPENDLTDKVIQAMDTQVSN